MAKAGENRSQWKRSQLGGVDLADSSVQLIDVTEAASGGFVGLVARRQRTGAGGNRVGTGLTAGPDTS
jgi:hypothetical protein